MNFTDDKFQNTENLMIITLYLSYVSNIFQHNAYYILTPRRERLRYKKFKCEENKKKTFNQLIFVTCFSFFAFQIFVEK